MSTDLDQVGTEEVAKQRPQRPQSRSPVRRLASRGLDSWPTMLATTALLLMVTVPLAFLILQSFREGPPALPEGWTLDNYREAASSRLWEALGNTLLVAVVGTSFSMFFAILFAWLIERTNLPLRNVAWAIMLLPVAIPSILFVLSWTVLLQPRAGLINVVLRDVLPFLGAETGPINIYGLGGVIFLDSIRGVTTVFLMLVAAFRMFDPALEEAARVGGLNVLQILRRVTIPAILPAIAAAGMYSFISSLDQFEAALAVGLPGGEFLLTTLIFFAVQMRVPINYGLGAVYSIGFMLVMLLMLVTYRRIVRQTARFATVTGKGYRPARIDLGKWRWPAFALVALFGLFTIVLPIWTMVWLSLRPIFSRIALGTGQALTLDNYRELWESGAIQRLGVNTITMTVATATLTMVLCFVVSWVIVRGRNRRMSGFVDALTFMPYAFPGITIALAFVVIFLSWPLRTTGIYGTITIVVLALVAQYVAFGTRLMNGAVTQIKVELEEACRIGGARQMATMLRITLPLLAPAVVAGWVWVAANAMRTFSVPAILASRNNAVFASEIWELWETGQFPLAAACGTVLVVILLPVTVLMRRMLTRISPN